MILFGFTSAFADSTNEQIVALTADMNSAIGQVQEIVNQLVAQLPRTPDMRVAVFSPGWFHAGATTPDFSNVDVRQTQQFPYDAHQYVSSDLNPGVAFPAHELEFNPMTKYFYTDRSLPKKRLTETEMLEINRLYRIIGQDQRQLAALENPGAALATQQALEKVQAPQPTTVKLQDYITTHRPLVVACLVLVIVAVLFARMVVRKRE